jgi:hypothetical protein
MPGMHLGPLQYVDLHSYRVLSMRSQQIVLKERFAPSLSILAHAVRMRPYFGGVIPAIRWIYSIFLLSLLPLPTFLAGTGSQSGCFLTKPAGVRQPNAGSACWFQPGQATPGAGIITTGGKHAPCENVWPMHCSHRCTQSMYASNFSVKWGPADGVVLACARQ